MADAVDAPVIRGGTVRDTSILLDQIQDAIDDGVGPVLSVWSESMMAGDEFDEKVAEICRAVRIPHGKIQISTVRRLREQGFTLVRERTEGEPECHHHVYFDEPVAESQVGRFVLCFDEPTPNPTGGNKRTM